MSIIDYIMIFLITCSFIWFTRKEKALKIKKSTLNLSLLLESHPPDPTVYVYLTTPYGDVKNQKIRYKYITHGVYPKLTKKDIIDSVCEKVDVSRFDRVEITFHTIVTEFDLTKETVVEKVVFEPSKPTKVDI